jgi:uncharacterized protein YrrD
MTEHAVSVGAKVTSKDGKRLGTVAKLIVRRSTQTVDGFLLGKGHFSTLKIVEVRHVAAIGHGGVVLKLFALEVETLPDLVEEQLLRAPGPLTHETTLSGIADVLGSGDTWVLHGSGGCAYPHTGSSPSISEAPTGNVEAENISNSPEVSVMVSAGVEVIGSDGKRVGRVDQLIVDDERRVTAFVVKSGRLLKRDFRLPLSAIAERAPDHVRLNLTADEAERGSSAS